MRQAHVHDEDVAGEKVAAASLSAITCSSASHGAGLGQAGCAGRGRAPRPTAARPPAAARAAASLHRLRRRDERQRLGHRPVRARRRRSAAGPAGPIRDASPATRRPSSVQKLEPGRRAPDHHRHPLHHRRPAAHRPTAPARRPWRPRRAPGSADADAGKIEIEGTDSGNSIGTVARIIAATSGEAPSIAMSFTMNSGRCSTLSRISANHAPTASRRAWSAK